MLEVNPLFQKKNHIFPIIVLHFVKLLCSIILVIFFFPEQIYLSISGLSLEWDETYVELLVTASKLQRQLVYAKEEEPAKVEMLERKISR